MGNGQEHGSKTPGVAALLSLAFPGLGQAWLGARRRGLLIALPLLGVIIAVAVTALVNPKALIEAVVHPGAIVVILVVAAAFGLYHLLAVRDAFRLGARAAPGMTRGGALHSPLLLVALAAVVGLYGLVEYVGLRTYEAETAIYVRPDSSFQIPTASFAPRPTTSVTLAPGATATTPPLPTATPVPVPAWAADGRLNLLLMGSDAGPGRWMARTDTMVVLSVDIATSRAALFGVPRNIVNVPLPPESAAAFPSGRFPQFLNALYVYAIGHPNKFPGGDARGFRAVSGAIQELLGVPLDGAVVVNLNGFVDLVDAIGGMWIDIPNPLYDAHYPKPDGTGYIEISFKRGCQELDGVHALEYARSRHQDDDYGRMRRQQAVLVALARQLDPIGLLPRVPDLLKIAQDNLFTTLDPNDIADLAVLAAHVNASEIQTIQFSPPKYPEYLDTKEINRIRDRVATVFDEPDVAPSPTPATTVKPCPRS